ncbi:MAG: hypothetical protein V3S24_13025 [Candidatus Tectomicrobia bacterium]
MGRPRRPRQACATPTKPFCLIGNASTVNTGAVDPIDLLTRLQR